MVEQNAFAALELSDRAYVLEQGRVTLTGTGADAARQPARQGRLPRRLNFGSKPAAAKVRLSAD